MPVATPPVVVQPTHPPHGELVEPRTAALPSGKISSREDTPSNLLTKIIVATYPRPPNLTYPSPRPLHGNCFRSRSKWGEDRRLRWRVTDPLSGEVPSKGSPAGTTTGVCWTSTSKGAFGSGRSNSPNVKPPKRNGRDQKSPDGRSSDRIIYLQRRASTTARLPSMQTMARRESGRGKEGA